MRPKVAVVFLLFALWGYLPRMPENIRAEERESIPERILKPLPDFDPFEKSSFSPQFFPDEVDKRVRETLIDSLTNREESLEGHVRFFMNRDARLKKERGTVTGLTERVLDLRNDAIRDRDRYLKAQKKALSASSPQQKQLIESRLHNDELTQAEELLKKSTTNRWGTVLNRLLSSVDIANILSGSYVGAAADATMSQLLALGSTEMSVEERKALALYLEHLRRHPDDPKKEAIQKQVETLEKKKKNVLVQKQMEKAEEAIGKKELDRALFYYELAAFIDPLSHEAKNGLKQLRNLLQQQEPERKEGISVATEQLQETTDLGSDRELTGLLDALTLRDQEQVEAQAKVLAEKYQGQPLAESARDALAVALEIKGRHEEAKKILQQIASSSSASPEKKRAELLLKSPEYNLLASFQQARSQHRLETVKYVLLGEDFLRRNLLGTAPLLASGPVGATSLAAANVVMIGTNLIQVLTSNPISYQPVIDKGVEYIRNHPQSKSATEVYDVLADAYEQAGVYDKAIAYLEMSGKASENKIADLKEKAAKAFLQAAEKSGERNFQQSYLKTILEAYPESAAAQEAVRRLAALAKIENQGFRISKQFLKENPELYGPQGLRLKTTLFDGNLGNMELADRGVSLLNEREILLHFQTPWGVQTQSYPIEKEASDRLQMMLRKKNYEVAMGDVHLREKGSPGGIKNLPLLILRGELEKKGSDSGETTFTLIQEAGAPSPDFPKVLDHHLVTENEKEGTKFKLPPVQGTISASGVRMSGSVPAGLWGEKIVVGTDEKSPFTGLQLPIPLLQGFIPVDFLLQGRPGRFSVSPKIHLYTDKSDDQELYR
jgi:hypothetical protein